MAIQWIHDMDYAAASASGVCVVLFRMDFCPGCEQMEKVLTKVAQQMPQVRFLALSLNRDYQVAKLLGVQSTPTMLVKNHGQIVQALVGVQTVSTMFSVLKPLVEAVHA